MAAVTKTDLPPIFCKQCGYCLYGLPENRCPECGRAFDPTDKRTYRKCPPTRRWRSVVRVLVLLVVFSMLPIGAWMWSYWQWRQEQPLIARLAAEQAEFEYTTIGPTWLEFLTPTGGSFVFHRLAKLHGYGLSDADLEGIETATELQEFCMWDDHITAATLRAVGRLRNLRILALERTAATAADLKELAGLRSLTALTLDGRSATAEGLGHLTRNANLRSLDLYRTDAGGEVVPVLQSFAELEELYIMGSSLKESDLMTLAALPRLEMMQVHGRRDPEPGAINRIRQAHPKLFLEGW